jgi:hypothetical protein
MDAKLTVKLDEAVINRAKSYAKKSGTSLSRMIESYLDTVTKSGKEEDEEITPLVKSLIGSFPNSKGFDYKKERAKYLAKKYK